MKIDFERLLEIKTFLQMLPFSPSTFMMDAGITLAIVSFIWALLLILNFILKIIWIRKEIWVQPSEGEIINTHSRDVSVKNESGLVLEVSADEA
jgi:hypothetical protein